MGTGSGESAGKGSAEGTRRNHSQGNGLGGISRPRELDSHCPYLLSGETTGTGLAPHNPCRQAL
eukprot:8328846-Prorocentrum_lima.AAC.1